MNQKGFVHIILIIGVAIFVVVAGYFVVSQRVFSPAPTPTPSPNPKPVACTEEAKQCPDGSYVGRTGQNCEFAQCPELKPSPIPTLNGEKIIRRVGEQESSFLIQKINSDSVDGLWFQAYPLARGEGAPKTLHIGDDIGYACEGVSEKLIDIDFSGQTVTFNKVAGQSPNGGCPICLSGKTLIDTPLGLILIKDLEVGMPIWTMDRARNRVSGIVTKISQVSVPPTHQMVHLVLSDGRELFVSPGHPTTDERLVGDIFINDFYDGAQVVANKRVAYDDVATYDILPSGETGFYWANGILLDSTLYF